MKRPPPEAPPVAMKTTLKETQKEDGLDQPPPKKNRSESPDKKSQTRPPLKRKQPQPSPPPPPKAPRDTWQELDIAVVDLFAGLRTVHLAAKKTRVRIKFSHAAEKCNFANKVAKKNAINETLFTDIKELKEDWA